MTTIACDGLTIASDTMTCMGNERTSLAKQKIVIEYGYVFGFSGEIASFPAARKWYAEGCDPNRIPKVSKDGFWNLIVFKESGVEIFSHDSPYSESLEYPQAFGSGSNYALGAMVAKVPAIEAVKAAIQIDVKSGGYVRAINLADALRTAEEQARLILMAAE